MTLKNLDPYKLVSIDNTCECAVKISNGMIFNIGLKNAIRNIATTITSSLVNRDPFGLYNIPTLIITCNSSENLNDINNIYCQQILDPTMQETVYARLHVYKKKIDVFFNEKSLTSCAHLGSWIPNTNQILGIGKYLQVSSADYTLNFQFDEDLESLGPQFGLYEENGHFYKKN